MMCPICGVEMRVGKTRILEEDGERITEQDLVCRSPQCPNYKSVVETVEIKKEKIVD
jgi:hypothetical protein